MNFREFLKRHDNNNIDDNIDDKIDDKIEDDEDEEWKNIKHLCL